MKVKTAWYSVGLCTCRTGGGPSASLNKDEQNNHKEIKGIQKPHKFTTKRQNAYKWQNLLRFRSIRGSFHMTVPGAIVSWSASSLMCWIWSLYFLPDTFLQTYRKQRIGIWTYVLKNFILCYILASYNTDLIWNCSVTSKPKLKGKIYTSCLWNINNMDVLSATCSFD